MNDEIDLKPIAFVAMPYGKRPTGINADNVPTEIDFEKLWQRAIAPALRKLNYAPIRADEQTGSVILKDMLEQLKYAELVIADLTLPNGNVYYEAGIRHGGREKGCVLIAASWSDTLFDVQQLTQLRYPLTTNNPNFEDYERISRYLSKNIPPLISSTSPYFELTGAANEAEINSKHLKEVSRKVFAFEAKLSSASLQARTGDNKALRELSTHESINSLPAYALLELVDAVRDNLEWGELVTLLDRLPEEVANRPDIIQRKAFAYSQLGRLVDGISLLDSLIKNHGPTPERLGTVGSRYRELSHSEDFSLTVREGFLNNAIERYSLGVSLDLNEYYCSTKLLVALTEKYPDFESRPDDVQVRLTQVSCMLEEALNRAEELDVGDEWFHASKAILAFYQTDATEAKHSIIKLIENGWHDWKLDSLLQDLKCIRRGAKHTGQAELIELEDFVESKLPVSQQHLLRIMPDVFQKAAKKYRKSSLIRARPAVADEDILSVTADGEETMNRAKATDMLVENQTNAKERYLVDRTLFNKSYLFSRESSSDWAFYIPTHQVDALRVNAFVLEKLGVGDVFYIQAPWGTKQVVKRNDYFIFRSDKAPEIYRVAAESFAETYTLEESDQGDTHDAK